VVIEHFIRGEVLLADVALVGLVDLAIFSFDFLLLGLPLLEVLVPHVLVEVLAIHERRGAEPTFVLLRSWLISEQHLFVLLSLDVGRQWLALD